MREGGKEWRWFNNKRTVALVVDAGGEGHGLVGDLLRVPEDVDRAAADGGEEHLKRREGGRGAGMGGWRS